MHGVDSLPIIRGNSDVQTYVFRPKDLVCNDMQVHSVTNELRSRRVVDSDKIKMLKQRYAMNFKEVQELKLSGIT